MNWKTPQRYALTAVLMLALLLLLVLHALPRKPSTGFFVGLAPARCTGDVIGDRLIVLRITDSNSLFINQEQEQWDTLASRLSDIYALRVHRTIYLSAEDRVAFQTVADAIDVVHNTQLGTIKQRDSNAGNSHIDVKLITPAALNAPCPQPVRIGSR